MKKKNKKKKHVFFTLNGEKDTFQNFINTFKVVESVPITAKSWVLVKC